MNKVLDTLGAYRMSVVYAALVAVASVLLRIFG